MVLSNEDRIGLLILGPAVVVDAEVGIEEGQLVKGVHTGVALMFELGEQRAL